MQTMPDFSSLMTGMSAGIFALVAIPFVIVAVLFVVWARRNRRRADASQNWSRTAGRIVHSDVEMRHSTSGHGTSTAYYPIIIYEYIIAGQRYQNDRRDFGPEVGYGFIGRSQEIAGRYKVGNLVDVYFDPVNPAESVLERRAGGSNTVLIAVGGVIVLILLCSGIATIGGMAFFGNFVNQVTSQVNGLVTQAPK